MAWCLRERERERQILAFSSFWNAFRNRSIYICMYIVVFIYIYIIEV